MQVGGNGNVDPLPKEKPDHVAMARQVNNATTSSEPVRIVTGTDESDARVSMDLSESGQDTKSKDSNVPPESMLISPRDSENSGSNSGSNSSGTGDFQSFENVCREALKQIQSNKNAALAKSSIGQIVKMLQAIEKAPDQAKLRKHRVDNIAIKKFVMEVPGALNLMKAVGFCETKSEKDLTYLSMEDGVFDARKVTFVIELLTGSTSATAAPREEKKQGPKTLCLGGCGYYGDESQEGYCSQCFKKKMCGGSTTTTTAPAAPVKCSNKCGFFGAAQYNGMCSVCFTKTGGVVKKAAAPAGAKQWRKKFRRCLLVMRCVRAFSSAPRLLQKNKTRCWECNKKVGLTGIDCKCGFIFCGIHRYPSEHNCRFDHKGRHQDTLRKNNQQIVSKKFDTIED